MNITSEYNISQIHCLEMDMLRYIRKKYLILECILLYTFYQALYK